MKPHRLAAIDRIMAEEAAEDIVTRLAVLMRQPIRNDPHHWTPHTSPETWSPEARDMWKQMVWLWQAAVTGRDPADTSPVTPDELTLLRLELL